MDAILSSINESVFGKNSFVRQMSDLMGVRPAVIVLMLVFFVLPFLMFGVGTSVVVTLVGMVWPAMESHKALQKRDAGEIEYLAKYWVSYTWLCLAEVFRDVHLVDARLAFVQDWGMRVAAPLQRFKLCLWIDPRTAIEGHPLFR